MNIDLTKLVVQQVTRLDVDETINFSNEKLATTNIRALRDVRFQGSITKPLEDTYRLSGEVTGIMVLPDDITLEDVLYPFSSIIDEDFNEFSNEEGNNLEIVQNRLDISEFLWQNILVEIPLKVKNEKNDDLTLEGNGWRLITEDELKVSSNSPFSELSKAFQSRKE